MDNNIVRGSEFFGKSLSERVTHINVTGVETIGRSSREYNSRLLLGTLLDKDGTFLSRIIPDSKSFLAPTNEIGTPVLELRNREIKPVIDNSEYTGLSEEEKIQIAHDKAVEYYKLFISTHPGLSEEIKRQLIADEIPRGIDLEDIETLFDEWTKYSQTCMTEEEIKFIEKKLN